MEEAVTINLCCLYFYSGGFDGEMASDEKETTMAVKQRKYVAHWSATPLVHLLGPLQEFIQQSQSSGIVLLSMTILALIIANSSLGASYFALLETHISL